MQATMDSEIARLVQAIAVAINPTQDKALQTQALEFIHQVQQNAQNHQVWSMALKLFTDSESGSSMRKYDSQTRLFALRILEEFLDNK
jgi:exportin-T